MFIWILPYCLLTKTIHSISFHDRCQSSFMGVSFICYFCLKMNWKTVLNTTFFFSRSAEHVARLASSVGICRTVVFAIKTGVLERFQIARDRRLTAEYIFPAKERSIGMGARGVSVAVSKGSRKIKDKGRKIAPQCRRLLVRVSLGYY